MDRLVSPLNIYRKSGSYPKGHRLTQLCAIVKNYLGVQRELGIYTQSRECMGLELAERSAGSHLSNYVGGPSLHNSLVHHQVAYSPSSPHLPIDTFSFSYRYVH
jgi:hypothetical protein